MKQKSTDDWMTKFMNVTFSALVKDDKDLAALRRDYASIDAQERRKAADRDYHSQMAEDSVEKHRRADALEPDNYKHLNDLGYSLLEAGKFDEAQKALQRSISLAPPDYEFSRNNLSELREKRKESSEMILSLNRVNLVVEVKPQDIIHSCLCCPLCKAKTKGEQRAHLK